METILEKVRRAISMYGMVNYGDSIFIGLSGGADSVSLISIMNELSEIYGINIQAIHVNHQLRGKESFRDEEFCRTICSNLGVPLHIKRIDVTTYCKEHRVSTEEGARILRYDVFKRFANGKIATAHTLSDNCETILYNLTRGTGAKGLMGIPPIRDEIIRPLILCTRNDVEEYLQNKGLLYVTDSSNLSNEYTRNKIRHNVVPILKEINPKFETKVLDTVQILAEDNDYIDGVVSSIYDPNLSKDRTMLSIDLRNHHSAIRHRCISRFLRENNLEYSRERILAIDDIIFSNGKINVTTDVYIVSNLGSLSIIRSSKECTSTPNLFMELAINGVTETPTKIIETVLGEKPPFINKKLTTFALDYDKIQGKAHLRSRIFGDTIKLKGRGFTSSVKKLLNENVPKEHRKDVCFIADDLGLIFMEYFGISQRVACDADTVNYLTIRIVKKYQD